MTLAATDVPAMVRFYNAVFEAGLEPVAALGTTLYRGTLGGVGLQLCPNEIAGVVAEQKRHQLRVRDVAGMVARAVANGGTVRDEVRGGMAVVDPDGNTVEVVAADLETD